MKLYLKYLEIHLKSVMQHKVSFFLTLTGQLITSFAPFICILLMFQRFKAVDKFSVQQVLLCYSIVLCAFSLAECFARGFDHFPSMISNGEFDRVLTRPRNEIVQILGSKADFSRLGRVIQGLLVLCYAIPTSNLNWTWDKVILLIIMILSGAAVFSGLFFLYASICFKTTQGLEVMNIFTDGGREFGQYPIAIYGKKVLKFLTFVIPIALFQYYPLLYLTGEQTGLIYYFAPIFVFIFLVPCYFVWKLGVRYYRSTGS